MRVFGAQRVAALRFISGGRLKDRAKALSLPKRKTEYVECKVVLMAAMIGRWQPLGCSTNKVRGNNTVGQLVSSLKTAGKGTVGAGDWPSKCQKVQGTE